MGCVEEIGSGGEIDEDDLLKMGDWGFVVGVIGVVC